MASPRPLRLYTLTFRTTRSADQLSFNRSGVTPCAAKNAAFVSLELELQSRPAFPKTGWYLESVRDISDQLPR